jgi:hypothetical protein
VLRQHLEEIIYIYIYTYIYIYIIHILFLKNIVLKFRYYNQHKLRQFIIPSVYIKTYI